jgi:hypothetical protein
MALPMPFVPPVVIIMLVSANVGRLVGILTDLSPGHVCLANVWRIETFL